MSGLRDYLSIEQLAARTPWTEQAIDRMIRRGMLRRGVHYYQPFGHHTQRLFKWSAIVGLIEGQRATVEPLPTPTRTTDVEKATTELQRLLA